MLPGIDVTLNDMHLKQWMQGSVLPYEDAIEINHCRLEKFACTFSDGLDAKTESGDLAVSMMNCPKKAELLIAHRMRTVSGADKTVVLKDGLVQEQGTPQELYSHSGVYRHMVDLQTGKI